MSSCSRTRRRPTASTGPERAWPAPIGEPPAEQAGVVVAYDVKTGQAQGDLRAWAGTTTRTALRSRASTISSSSRATTRSRRTRRSRSSTRTSRPTRTRSGTTPAGSTASGSTIRAVNDYYDVPIGSTASYPGTFVPIAPAARPRARRRALETASDAAGVFQFVRVEDIAYDKRSGSGERRLRRRLGSGARTPRTATRFASRNGRIWKLEFTDPDDPTKDDAARCSSRVTISPVKTPGEIHQPDNLETTPPGA